MFEAEKECGRPCPLRLSETGTTWLFLFVKWFHSEFIVYCLLSVMSH